MNIHDIKTFFCCKIFKILGYFYVKTAPLPEKLTSSFPATPSKNLDPVTPSPTHFENLVEGSPLLSQQKKEGVYTMILNDLVYTI